MLKKFILKNYKNFKDEICINFDDIKEYQFSTDCIMNNVITKMLIYGRNATGKTNLGKAFMNIKDTIFVRPRYISSEVFINADSLEDAAVFSYVFQFDGRELIYNYSRFSDQYLKDEELIIDGITIFKFNFVNKDYNFDNLSKVGAETANIDRYLQSLDSKLENEEIWRPRLPFLRWLISNVALDNNSLLIRLANYVGRMVMVTVGNSMSYRMQVNDSFNELLEEEKILKDLESFLNAMGIECKLVLKKLPDDRRELYFEHKKLVPFYENASSGTLVLVDLYKRLIPSGWAPSLIYLDEFDAFYHYEMAEKVIEFFKKRYPESQMIMTSHNTNLMTNRLMRPDCMFILSRTGTLTSLCNATGRELKEVHNLRKMYISGEFEAYE